MSLSVEGKRRVGFWWVPWMRQAWRRDWWSLRDAPCCSSRPASPLMRKRKQQWMSKMASASANGKLRNNAVTGGDSLGVDLVENPNRKGPRQLYLPNDGQEQIAVELEWSQQHSSISKRGRPPLPITFLPYTQNYISFKRDDELTAISDLPTNPMSTQKLYDIVKSRDCVTTSSKATCVVEITSKTHELTPRRL
jgi:hypothetical protein